MDEHGAAPPGHARPRVVVDFHNDIIEMVISVKAVARRTGPAFDRAVVVAVGGILRPGVVRARFGATVSGYVAAVRDPAATRFSRG